MPTVRSSREPGDEFAMYTGTIFRYTFSIVAWVYEQKCVKFSESELYKERAKTVVQMPNKTKRLYFAWTPEQRALLPL